MTKTKKSVIAVSIMCCLALGLVGAKTYSTIEAKKTSEEAMIAEINEITAEITDVKDAVTVEYGANTINLWSAVLKAKQEHPDFHIDYTVDGETELAAFSTKTVGEHVITYTVSAEDAYGQSVSNEWAVVYTVEDTQVPVITLAQEKVTVYEGGSFDVASLVESAYDAVDGELEPTITTDYTEESPTGDYEVQISATDCNGLTSEATATIHVVAKPQKKLVEASAATSVASTQSYYDPSRIYIGSYTAVVYFSAEDQATTDAPDAAICYEQHGRTVVADHAYQGFNAIISNTSGVLHGSGIHRVSIHYGTASDDRTDIYYDDGGSLLANNDAPIVMYTCAGGTGRYAVTYWDYD